MKTELTKRITQLTHSYKPQMSTGQVGRTIRFADEVWTPSGIVDSIRFEDYVSDIHDDCIQIHYELYPEKDRRWLDIFAKGHLGECKLGGMNFPRKECRGCVNRIKEVREVGILITCYEVKITKADFKSKNGHNFHGNENYYVVPKELAPKIEEFVPEGVGILSYYCGQTTDGLRLYKPSARKDIDEELKVILLYNAMKKWCDGAMYNHF